MSGRFEESSRDLAFDLSGLGVRLRGTPVALAERFEREWGAFASAPPVEPFLDAEVSVGDVAPGRATFAPKGMEARLGRDVAEYRTEAGEARVAMEGRASIRLAPRDGAVAFLTMGNLVRACVAWLLPSRGGAAVHGAGFALDGRGFLVVGSSGAGKSTAARLAESAGATVVSDDLVLVDGASGRFEILGAPFRSSHPSPSPPGRWPLAALLFPVHAASAGLDAVTPLWTRARVAANLPFVAEAMETDPRIVSVMERLSTEVPARAMRFALDPSFVNLLRSFT